MLRPRETLEWKRLVRRFRVPLGTASGEYAVRESLVVRLTDAAGRTGYGEVAPWPGFPVESLAEAEAQLSRVRDAADDGMPCPLPAPPEVSAHLRFSSTPCVAAALGHAREWIQNNRGMAEFSLPCAGLLRDAGDLVATENKCAEGFSTLKLKIARGPLRGEQRAVSLLVRKLSDMAPVRLRLDANGALDPAACEAWCEFLGEFPEIEWLEQPLPVGAEALMREIAERAGVADRIALDESACRAEALPGDWPGVLAVKPLLLGDPEAWRSRRDLYPRIAYASVFESPFGRQTALCVAAEGASPGAPAAGFDTLGAFADDLDRHAPGPVARTLPRGPDFWEDLWRRIP